jgi:beta-phosphoglucomutase-like phosphatase (HAD superfamily)
MDVRPSRGLVPELVPPPGVKALLFDCDGTLVDTLGVYRHAWTGPLADRGFDMSEEWFDRHAGMAMRPFLEDALGTVSQEEYEAVEREGLDSFLAHLHLVVAFEHVVDIARAYHGVLPLAVVSGGPESPVLRSLDAAGILPLFEMVITADQVEHSKPAPDGYLLAARRLGFAPAECVAYEDSETGLRSARAAGIPVIDVRGTG